MKRKLVFATNNAHKLEEVAAILGDQIELLSLNDIGCHTDIPETAETLEGNALLKSSFIFKNYGLDCFADDTGLEVEALDGAPESIPPAMQARRTRRPSQYAQTASRTGRQRKSQSTIPYCHFVDIGRKGISFEGVIKGEIIREKRGDSGFGYDPVFKPEGYERTFAELGNDVKNKISHRALAVQNYVNFYKANCIYPFKT